MLIEKTHTGNKFHGQVLGIVKKVNDNGTYKVWIPGIYAAEFIENLEKLPDARILYPPFLGDAMDYSMGGPLLEGTKVYCFFDNAEITKPVIIGKFLSDEVYEALAKQNQTSTLVKQVSLKIGKSKLVMKESGDIEITSLPTNESDANPISKITMDASGNINITGENISINASENLNLAGSAITSRSQFNTNVFAGSDIIMDGNSFQINYKSVVKAINKTLRRFRSTKFFKNYQRILAGWFD